MTEQFYTSSFSTIDFNVAPTTGFVVYQLFAQIAAAGSTASASAPLRLRLWR